MCQCLRRTNLTVGEVAFSRYDPVVGACSFVGETLSGCVQNYGAADAIVSLPVPAGA